MPTTKGGTIARKALAQKKEANAPVELETMLGEGPSVEINGRRFRIYPVPLMSHARLQEAMSVLGDAYLMPALSQDNPKGLANLARMLNAETPDIDTRDVEVSLRLAAASHTPEQINAMLDFCVIAFNPAPPEGVTWDGYKPAVTRDVIGRHLTARAFPAVLRAVLDASGLNPTPLG